MTAKVAVEAPVACFACIVRFAGRVCNDEFATRGRKIAVRHVNGDALFASRRRPSVITEKNRWACGTVDTLCSLRPADLRRPTWNRAGAADQSRLAVVDAPRRRKAKKLVPRS